MEAKRVSQELTLDFLEKVVASLRPRETWQQDLANLQLIYRAYKKLLTESQTPDLNERLAQYIQNLPHWSQIFKTERGSRYFVLPSRAELRIIERGLQAPRVNIGFVSSFSARKFNEDWQQAIDLSDGDVTDTVSTYTGTIVKEKDEINILFDGILFHPAPGLLPISLLIPNLDNVQFRNIGHTKLHVTVLPKDGIYSFPMLQFGHAVSEVMKKQKETN